MNNKEGPVAVYATGPNVMQLSHPADVGAVIDRPLF